MQRNRNVVVVVSVRGLWKILQGMGHFWRPRMVRFDGSLGSLMASGWSLGNRRFFTSINAEAYQGQIANLETAIPY